jgi:hypothetical protein
LFVFGPFALRGGIDLTLAASSHPGMATGALTVHGVATSTGMATFTSLLQAGVPATHRGRVLAAFDILWQSEHLVWLLMAGTAGLQ